MILKETLRAVPRRMKQPLVLGLAIGLLVLNQALLLGLDLVARHVPGPAPQVSLWSPRMMVGAIAGVFFLFGLSPAPWQWTGDGQRMARPGRGLLQVLVFNGLYLLGANLLNWPYVQAQLQTLPQSPVRPLLPLFMAMGALVSLAYYGAVGFALALWETRRAEKEEAQRQADEARWTLLKAQMSPHVLLNSLNGLAELVREDPGAAAKGMRDLSEVYRQLLLLGEAPKVPLGRERQLLERYLDVEGLRLGDRLKVDWDWEEGLDGLPAMPLLLQPLVENAIKHGVAADPAGGLLRIEGRRTAEGLLLKVSNTGAGFAATRRGTGVGLRNLRSRLELAYGGRAAFELVQELPWVRAELRLPLDETAAKDGARKEELP